MSKSIEEMAAEYFEKTGYVPTEWAVMNFTAGAKAQREIDAQDTRRLDWFINTEYTYAYVPRRTARGKWRIPGGDEYDSPRAAIDAAMKSEKENG